MTLKLPTFETCGRSKRLVRPPKTRTTRFTNGPSESAGAQSGDRRTFSGAARILEIPSHLTDPKADDTDGDGLSDQNETVEQHTSSLTADSVNDAIPELSEITEDQDPDPEAEGDQHTNPVDSDTDNDLADDFADVHPTVADWDFDGIVDGIENITGTDP